MVEFSRYVPKKVSDIDPEVDVRVRITGTIIDSQDSVILVDDGTGTVRVVVSDQEKKLNMGDLVRVFGVISKTPEGIEIVASVLQKMNGFDLNLFKKVEELYNRWGCKLYG